MTAAGGSAAGRARTGPAAVRTVALVGHAGAGKTALAQALLAAAGGGSTDPRLGLFSLSYDGLSVHLLDSGGDCDAAAADAALFVVSAADGVDGGTIARWEQAGELPRAVVVTHLDRPRADFDEVVAICRRVFGDGIHPLCLPVHDDADSGAVVAVIDLLTEQLHDYSGGGPPRLRDSDPEHRQLIADTRADLLEDILAESADETLLDSYLTGAATDPAVLADELAAAVSRAALFPVLAAVPPTGLGAAELLELIAGSFPSPLSALIPAVTDAAGQPIDPPPVDAAGPLLAEVISTDGAGTALVRVWSGTVPTGGTVQVGSHSERPPRQALVEALPDSSGSRDRCSAGDLCGVGLPPWVLAGDTLSDVDNPLLLGH